jgi:hypothetical protein
LKWEATPATIDDCRLMLSRASAITRQDWELLGLDEGAAETACAEYLKKGDAIACWVDGELHGVFGVFKSLDGSPPVWETWSLWSDEVFGRLGVQAALAMRSVLKSLQRTIPEALIVATSHSPHPDVDRWFKALGFAPVPGVSDGRVFSYRKG